MRRTLACLLLSLSLSACVVNNVATDYDPQTLFAGIGRYAWAPLKTEDQRFTSLDQQRIQTATDQALTTHAMQPVAPAEAELWVQGGIDLREVRDVSTVQMGGTFGHPLLVGGDTIVQVQQYTEAVIFVQFIDPKTSRVVWRGQLTRPWSEHMAPAKREKILHDAVIEILANYPPRSTP